MTRLGGMFGGMGGGKGSTPKRGSIGEFAKNNPDFMKLDPSKRNEVLANMKIESKMAELSSRKSSSSFSLPGTAPGQEKELSKTAKDMIEKLMKKQLAKRKKEIVAIRACWFGNGCITKDGKIYDANNKMVGKIDPDTMKISIGMSFMGKYKDDSFTLTKLSNKIASMNSSSSGTSSSGGGGMGNFYGTSSDNNGGGGWW